jgi:hypothetical protein
MKKSSVKSVAELQRRYVMIEDFDWWQFFVDKDLDYLFLEGETNGKL